jgi:hypothetical protein
MVQHATIARTRLRRTWLERLDMFLRSNAVRLVLLLLVANTILAQAFFNSGGRILVLFGMNLTAIYLNLSAVLSTLAFSLFEIAMLWARQEVLALDDSIKKAIGAGAWLTRNRYALIAITAINFYSLAVFNAAIWPDVAVPGIPEPASPWRFYLHAAFYTAILYLAGIVGERVKSEQEVSMTMARRHTQQALAAHDAQFSQQIKDMTEAGDPLAPLVAATSSPETAQLVALQHLAVTGQVSVMDAARLNAAAKGHDTALLDKLLTHQQQQLSAPMVSGAGVGAAVFAEALDAIDEAQSEVGAEADSAAMQQPPNGRYSHKRLDERLAATR